MNPWYKKVLLSTAVICSLSMVSVSASAYMAGSSKEGQESLISSDLIWKEHVRTNAKTITSVKLEKEDEYNDLKFLKSVLADKQIVSLGEASHGASEYNSMKVRLVQFLHEELGFNVIAFESNLSDTATAYSQVQQTTPEQLMKNSIFGVWQVKENLPLFEYIAAQSKTDHPLILTGFDAQGPKESFITFIKDWFAQVDPSKASGFAQTEQ